MGVDILIGFKNTITEKIIDYWKKSNLHIHFAEYQWNGDQY